MKHILITIITIIIWGVGFNQIDSINKSPRDIIYNHLFNLQKESYNPDLAAKSFKTEKAQKLAIKLKQILDGKGIYIDFNKVPEEADYIDSVTQENIYYLSSTIPQVYVKKTKGKWHYSAVTAQEIPALFKEVYPLSNQLSTYFTHPKWKVFFLGIQFWQWFCLVLMFVAFAVFTLVFKYLIRLFFVFFNKTRFYKAISKRKSFYATIRLVAYLISLKIIVFFIPSIQLSLKLNILLLRSIEILSVFFIIFLILKVIKVLFEYFEKKAEVTESKMDDQLLPVLQKISSFIIWTIGLAYVFSTLNVNITALLAGLSIGGLALALAAQDTVKNFFGSVMIFIDKPFQIGDWIHFDNVDGVVEEVGVRSTRIRTFANSLVYVPNAKLADATIDNMGLRTFRRYKTEIGVTYDTPPEVINVFVLGIKQIIKTHPTTKKDNFEVCLNSFGSSSLNILVYCFFEASAWSDELKARHQIIYAIIKLANDLGVRFAFPTQTLHIEEFPEKKSDTPKSKKEQEAIGVLNSSIKEIDAYFNQPNNDNTLK
jgi:MscS family membrane protein